MQEVLATHKSLFRAVAKQHSVDPGKIGFPVTVARSRRTYQTRMPVCQFNALGC